MRDYIYIRIGKLLPRRLIYWCVVKGCNEVHRKMQHLKNRDEININMVVNYWYNETK
jgi:hypothetical protein